MEVEDVYQVDFNDGRRALRVSVSPLMYPSVVAECIQVVGDAYMKAAEALLLSPGAFEAETAHRNVVAISPLEKRKVVNRDDSGQIRGKQDSGASREFTV